MPYLEEIVTEINAVLKASSFKDKRFANIMLAGISTPIIRDSAKGGDNIVPGIIDNAGEVHYVSPDDNYVLTAYHKINSTKYVADTKDGFSESAKIATSNMSMVVFAMRKEIKLSHIQLEGLIMAGFPDRMKAKLTGWQLKKLTIAHTDSNFGSRSIFNTEFQGAKYFLNPMHILFQINYTIESSFDKRCFETCDCP